MMKNILVLMMVLVITVSFYACSPDKNENKSEATQTITQTATQKITTTPVATQTAQIKSILTPEQENLMEYAFHTYILWVPGVSYTVDDYNANTSTLYTSAGTVPKSTITIKKDGTYTWNSDWDGKIIDGNWTFNSDGTINILKGQEGKNWYFQQKDESRIYIGDGFIYYEGESVTVKNK